MRRYLVLLALVFAAVAGGASNAAEPAPQALAPVAAPDCGDGFKALQLPTSGQWGCTHLSEDRAITLSPAAAAARKVPTAPVKCYGDGTTGPRIQMIYGYHDGQPNRAATVVNQVRTLMAPRMQAVINYQSQGRDLGLRFLWTKGCGAIDVKVVKFPGSVVSRPGDAVDQIRRITDFLQSKGYNREDRKYQVLWDGYTSGGVCGIAFTAVEGGPDSVPYARRAEGLPTVGGRTAPLHQAGLAAPIDGIITQHSVVFNHVGGPKGPTCFFTGTKSTVTVQLHELFHNLGAVQTDAPHADKGHCFDAPSVMCSGGVPGYGGGVTNKVCAKAPVEVLDCGEDDYWNANPTVENYLFTHLNIAKSQFFGPQPQDNLATAPL